MFVNIEGNSADDIWTKSVKMILNTKISTLCETRLGPAKELLHVAITLKNPRERWVTSRYPAMNPAFALAELIWILNGANDANVINFWNPKLPQYAGDCKTYHGAYGNRIRKHFGIDQLLSAYNILKHNPSSRQVVLQIWDSKVDLPNQQGQPVSNDIPCNICSVIKIRNDKLEWMQIVRSNDAFLGLPYNFIQFTSIQEILSGWLGVSLGEFHQVSDSLHIYEHDISVLKVTPKVRVTNSDVISVTKREFDSIIKKMYKIMCILSERNINFKEIYNLTHKKISISPYNNMMLIISADAARRKGLLPLACDLVSECTNPLYKHLWHQWVRRTSKI